GIRDYKVTGVQTCALPILGHTIINLLVKYISRLGLSRGNYIEITCAEVRLEVSLLVGIKKSKRKRAVPDLASFSRTGASKVRTRSEERRVGKEGGAKGAQE